jgi:CO/xanthine dehydrogenase Mo-binding subunit
LAGVAAVLVDREIGQITIRKLVAVHDSRALNPMILEGQLHGAIANGLGGVLFEGFEYDEQRNLLTSTYMDCLPISAMEMPELILLILDHIETPSPFTVLGAKGSGEGEQFCSQCFSPTPSTTPFGLSASRSLLRVSVG